MESTVYNLTLSPLPSSISSIGLKLMSDTVKLVSMMNVSFSIVPAFLFLLRAFKSASLMDTLINGEKEVVKLLLVNINVL